MYHPSSYAKMLDAEWIEVKKVIADLNAAKAEIEAKLYICVPNTQNLTHGSY
jgi:hypothetical protein